MLTGPRARKPILLLVLDPAGHTEGLSTYQDPACSRPTHILTVDKSLLTHVAMLIE